MPQSGVEEYQGKPAVQTNETEARENLAGQESESAPAFHRGEIYRVAFVAVAAAALWFLGKTPNPYITAIGVICTLVGGFPIFAEAYENITQRRMTMERSMAIAIVAALAIREIFTALVITLFVLGAEILEGLTVGRGRRAIERLIELLPKTATVRRQAKSSGWLDKQSRTRNVEWPTIRESVHQ
jgi:cation transport ATPase